jgi:hypothetical protein
MNLCLYLQKFANCTYDDSEAHGEISGDNGFIGVENEYTMLTKDALFFFSGYGPEDFYRNYTLKRVLENPRFGYFFPITWQLFSW